MAYWHVNHGTDPRRAVSSQPVRYGDLLHTLLISKGINPSDVSSSAKPSGAPGTSRTPARAPRGFVAPGSGPAVRAFGGKLTPGLREHAAAWSRDQMPADMAKRTGADPAAIAWALQPD